MTNLLETDVSDVGRRLSDFGRWWLRELAAALTPPPPPKRVPHGLPVVEVVDGEVRRQTPSGFVSLEAAPLRRRSVVLQLPETLVLRRTLAVPRLGRTDTERMLHLDSDRLTPFPLNTAYHQVVLSPAAAGSPTREVDLVSTPRSVADQALDGAELAGLHVKAVRAWDGPDGGVDLLPLMRGLKADAGLRAAGMWWALALALVAVNIGVWVWRDVGDTRALEAQVLSQRTAVARASDLVRNAQALRAHVAGLVEDRRDREPLRLMQATSEAMPAGAGVERLEIRGDRVRLVGVRAADLDVAAALRKSPNVRAVSQAGGAAAGSERFDVVAQVSTLRQRALQ